MARHKPTHQLKLASRSRAQVGTRARVFFGILCGRNVAEFEHEFEPEIKDRFVIDLVVSSLAVTLTFV